MKLRSGWLVRLVALLAAWMIRWWMSTVRRRIFFADGLVHPVDARVEKFIYAFWHDSFFFIAATPWAGPSRIHVLISQHADGELIARTCRHLRFGVVRGSTSRGGAGALLQLLHCSRRSHLGVTPDGPRGPRRQVQLGSIYAASFTGLPIVPVGVGYERAWRSRSWDRFGVPWAWSVATCVFGPPVHVPPSLGREGLEHYRRLVEERMHLATEAAERWAAGGSRPRSAQLGNDTPEVKACA
jgi:lysophospholipid acyltransferase (LPLAT)-like uncharacterized protein